MKTSPLQLDSYCILHTKVVRNENRIPEESAQDVNLKVGVGRGCEADNPRKWKIDLHVIVEDTDEVPSPYSIDIKLRGFFSVEDGYPEDRVEMMVAANAPAVLYGSARELVMSLTARGPGSGGVILPSITFIDDAKKLEAKKKEETLLENKSDT
jgi:preprotein translocase subunit SecB